MKPPFGRNLKRNVAENNLPLVNKTVVARIKSQREIAKTFRIEAKPVGGEDPKNNFISIS